MSTTPIAKGGRRDRTTLSLTLKGHFSTKCSSANILNLVHEIKLIKMSRLTMSIRVLLQSNVVNDINLKIKVFPKQPLGTPIFKRFKNWGKRILQGKRKKKRLMMLMLRTKVKVIFGYARTVPLQLRKWMHIVTFVTIGLLRSK